MSKFKVGDWVTFKTNAENTPKQITRIDGKIVDCGDIQTYKKYLEVWQPNEESINYLTSKEIEKPSILILWDDGKQAEVPILSNVRGIKREGMKPSGFFFEPNQPTYGVSKEEFLRWLHEEFKYIFEPDVFDTYLGILKYKE